MARGFRTDWPWPGLPVVAVVCLWSAATPAALPQEVDLDRTVAALPGELRSVTTGGRWHASDERGVYRVVTLRGGYEHVADRLYIQWVREGNESGPPQVVATVSVSEINDEGPYTITHTIRPEGTSRLRVTVDAHHGYAKTRRRLVLVATTPRSYSVQ